MRKQQQPPAQEPEKFERWTAQRKVAIILEVLKRQISVPEASRRYGFTQGEYRKWADEFMRGGIDALKVNRKGLDAEHRNEVRRLQAKIGQLVMENEIAREALRIIPLDENEQRSIDSLLGKGFPRVAVCRILNMPRSSTYYRPRARANKIDEVLAQRIKHIIDDESYLGYRMVWATLRGQGILANRKAVQRIMQLKGWQCHRRLHKSCYPRVQMSSSIAAHSNERWATDFTCVWTKYDGLVYVNEVIDCADRSVVGYCISKNCRAQEAVWALEDACIKRFGILPRGDAGVVVRSDNGLVFASRLYRRRGPF